MDKSDIIVSSVEIIKDKLYFATLKGKYKPKASRNSKYFTVSKSEIVYESFFFDYGPHHLCHLYLFCNMLNERLPRLCPGKKLVYYSSDNKVQRLNAAYLIGSYAIIYLNKSPDEIFDSITEGKWELLTFRDASGGYHLFEISLLDVFEGLHRAFHGGFFNFDNFNAEEYSYYEKVLNGDLNWIIPEKMLAFSGPHAQSKIKDDYPLHAPSHYHKYFKDNNVTAIVRLNQRTYNAKQFTDFGFEHYELFFVDGSVPSDVIVDKFNIICERTKGAVAVHCKAGLGRTGTLIACYLMKHHQFTARQAISWLRICRPGSVIGFQQNFLIGIQERMLMEGVQYRLKNGISEIPKFKNGIYSNPKFKLNSEDVENGNIEKATFFNGNDSDDLENTPSIKPTVQKLEREDSSITSKQNKDDFVSLDSIIDSKKSDLVVTRSMATKTRASTALASAKSTYTANKNNYMMSNSNNPKSTTVKVQTTFTPKKLQAPSSSVGSSPKSANFSFAKGTMTHSIKVALTKNQYAKRNLLSQRANLARNHNQVYSHSADPFNTFVRKTTNCMKTTSNQENANKTTEVLNYRLRNSKEYDPNLNLMANTSKNVNENTPQKMNVQYIRKKIVIRKKPAKGSSTADQINNFKNCNISNSDSELDSNGTALTNMSADSLENIPCKMATRRDKSRTPELIKRMDDDLNNGTDTLDGLDPQGSQLCHIKATRKKVARNYTNLGLIKKK